MIDELHEFLSHLSVGFLAIFPVAGVLIVGIMVKWYLYLKSTD